MFCAWASWVDFASLARRREKSEKTDTREKELEMTRLTIQGKLMIASGLAMKGHLLMSEGS